MTLLQTAAASAGTDSPADLASFDSVVGPGLLWAGESAGPAAPLVENNSEGVVETVDVHALRVMAAAAAAAGVVLMVVVVVVVVLSPSAT